MGPECQSENGKFPLSYVQKHCLMAAYLDPGQEKKKKNKNNLNYCSVTPEYPLDLNRKDIDSLSGLIHRR